MCAPDWQGQLSAEHVQRAALNAGLQGLWSRHAVTLRASFHCCQGNKRAG